MNENIPFYRLRSNIYQIASQSLKQISIVQDGDFQYVGSPFPEISQQFDPQSDQHYIEKIPKIQGKKNVCIHEIKVKKYKGQINFLAKIIYFQSDQYEDSDFIKQLINREVYYLNNINSQHCIKYYGIQIQTNFMCIYMQNCQGWNLKISLRDYIRSEQYFNPKDIKVWENKNIQIIVQLLMAVKDLNQKFIIHKDLKPQNILFKKDGSIRVIDFDISQIFYKQNFLNVGTDYYKAPELQNLRISCSRFGNIDSPLKLDIWSIGFIIYELFQTYNSIRGFGPKWPYYMCKLKYLTQHYSHNMNIYKQIQSPQNQYYPFDFIDNHFQFLKHFIQRMLEIKNSKRISFHQIYSSKQFSQFIKYLLKLREKQTILSFLSKQKILELFMYKQFYARIEEQIKQLIDSKQQYLKFFQKYFYGENHQPLQTLDKVIQNVQKILNIKSSNKVLAITTYRLFSKMEECYQKAKLKQINQKAHAASYNLIKRLRSELQYRFRVTYGQILSVHLKVNQNLEISKTLNYKTNIYNNKF